MRYLPRAQEQLNGDLLVPEATKRFLHRALQDLQQHMEGQSGPDAEVGRASLLALEKALGPCFDPLPSAREMLDLPDPVQEARGRNLLTLARI